MHYAWSIGDLQKFEKTFLFHKIEAIRQLNGSIDPSGPINPASIVSYISTLCVVEVLPPVLLFLVFYCTILETVLSGSLVVSWQRLICRDSPRGPPLRDGLLLSAGKEIAPPNALRGGAYTSLRDSVRVLLIALRIGALDVETR